MVREETRRGPHEIFSLLGAGGMGDAPPSEDKWIWITDHSTFHDKGWWSPDGNLLYYTSDGDGFKCIRAWIRYQAPRGTAFRCLSFPWRSQVPC